MKTMPRFQQYVDEYLVDDKEVIMKAAEVSILEIEKRFNMRIPEASMALCIYGVTFDTLIALLKKKRKDHNDYSVDVASYFTVCFENEVDETAEKIGNFMVQYIPRQPDQLIHSDDIGIEGRQKSKELCTKWNAAHIIQDTEFCKNLQEHTRAELAKLDINLATSELILPLFCTIHECLMNAVISQLQDLELSTYSITVLGIATIGAREDASGNIEVYMLPPVSPKVDLKDDALASRD
nr:MAG TPA: hypothetical protein [Caudoviricetes sp.]